MSGPGGGREAGVRTGAVRTAVHLVAVTGAMAAVAGLALGAAILWPSTDATPRRADALVVLSGDHGERLARAKELLAGGVAPTLVLVGTPDSAENLDMCAGRTTFDVVCLRPEPDNTRTEAAATAELARDRDWEALVVVTSTPHVSRARLLFDRCFPGTLDVVGADPRT
ncbi:MAG TPA: ElyC/SanA/YdcF family protein, partial [Acidimicrobiales bacterium]|nr:ElyC/SanA/YdcF family protein [Acidimicrobiales bacterium]